MYKIKIYKNGYFMLSYVFGAWLLFMSHSVYAFEYTQVITEQEIQDKVSAVMPLQQKKYFITVKISEPQIDLIKSTDEISIQANIETSAPGNIKASGKTMIAGTLSYNAPKGAFYIKNLRILSLSIKNLPEKFTPEIIKMAQIIISKALDIYPVYTLSDANTKEKLAKAVLKSINVKNETLHVTLGMF